MASLALSRMPQMIAGDKKRHPLTLSSFTFTKIGTAKSKSSSVIGWLLILNFLGSVMRTTEARKQAIRG